MNSQKRRDLLAKLEKVAACDGNTSEKTIYRTFCEALRELLMDSVYIEIPQDADTTEEIEVEVTTNG